MCCVYMHIYICKEGPFHFCIFVYLSLSLLGLLLFAFQFFFVTIIFIFESICVEKRMFGFLIFNDFLKFIFLLLFSSNLFSPQKLRLKYKTF